VSFQVDDRGVVEVLIPGAYQREHPDADVVTCGHCGRGWDDAVVTGWTPTPAGRCPFEAEHEYAEPCQWFALCENDATQTRPHPILGDVPICDRCAARVDELSR
jgi:hypothetical protein